jgi:hypothetical protein
MRNHRAVVLLLLVVPALAVASCRSRTDRSEGTVLLSISDFGTLPLGVSLTDPTDGNLQIDSITIRSVAKDPTGTTGPLMDVELRSFEVTYRRRDTGSRLPPPLSGQIFSTVPVNGTAQINGTPIFLTPQLAAQPLKDLIDFGVDRETGTSVIILDVSIRFFGRTLSGDDVATQPASFTLEVRR